MISMELEPFGDGWTISCFQRFGDIYLQKRKMSFVLPFRSLRASQLTNAFVQEFQAELVEVQPKLTAPRVVIPMFHTLEQAQAALEYAEAINLAFYMGETK